MVIKLLIVDDDEDIRFIISDNLKKQFTNKFHFLITEACDGKEGLESLEHELYDLAINDMAMPLRNGK